MFWRGWPAVARRRHRAAQVLMALAVVVALVWAFGPVEKVDLTPRFDAAALPDDLDAYLSAEEARMGAVTPGAEKRIVWARGKGVQTDLAIVYLHGFSATSQEIRPVPDAVARGLGANIFFTRLAGHGLPGDRLSGPTVQDWMDDVAEALAIGQRIGRKVVVIGTSTGGTLAAEAAVNPALRDKIAGIVFISPNFRLQSHAAPLLTWPAARYWLPILGGRTRCFDPVNDRQAKFWTTCYPSSALFPMAALVAHARAEDYSAVTIPALFLYSRQDQVVTPGTTEEIARRWGGAGSALHEALVVKVAPGDDPASHVIAGDILSPSMTGLVTRVISDWIAQRIVAPQG